MNNYQSNKGNLEVICGSMFSGKTEELMRRLKRAEFAKKNILPIKHIIDTRSDKNTISSHNGTILKALPVNGNELSSAEIIELVHEKNISIVGIDEIQFFPSSIISLIITLLDLGIRVIVAGLDLDFRGEPFGIMPILMAIADDITKLKAICVTCGKDAHHSQRIINNKPANYDDPIILVGASESYEARCKNCFSIDKKLFSLDYEKKNNISL